MMSSKTRAALHTRAIHVYRALYRVAGRYPSKHECDSARKVIRSLFEQNKLEKKPAEIRSSIEFAEEQVGMVSAQVVEMTLIEKSIAQLCSPPRRKIALFE